MNTRETYISWTSAILGILVGKFLLPYASYVDESNFIIHAAVIAALIAGSIELFLSFRQRFRNRFVRGNV